MKCLKEKILREIEPVCVYISHRECIVGKLKRKESCSKILRGVSYKIHVKTPLILAIEVNRRSSIA